MFLLSHVYLFVGGGPKSIAKQIRHLMEIIHRSTVLLDLVVEMNGDRRRCHLGPSSMSS